MLSLQRAFGQALERLPDGELKAFFLVFVSESIALVRIEREGVAEPEQAERGATGPRMPADFFKLEYANL